MTDQPQTSTGQPAPGETPDPAPRAAAPLRGARDAWQAPAALLGLVLVVLGVVALLRTAEGPDFDGVIADAEALMSHQRYEEALEVLNGPILQELAQRGAPEAVIGRYHALRAESIFLASREARLAPSSRAAEANNTSVVEEFRRAERIDPALITPRRAAFMAEAMLELGRFDDAMTAIESLPDEEGDRRRRLLRRAAADTLAGPAAFHARAHRALAALRTDPALPEEDRLWVVARQMESMLSAGQPERVIEGALPEIQRAADPSGGAVGELFLLLGRAYMELGDQDRARAQLSLAEANLPPGDARQGEVEVLIASIVQARGEVEEARDRFASAAERFPGGAVEARALAGMGETEAELGRPRESLRAYARALDMLRSGSASRGISAHELEASLEQRHRARSVAGDLETALEYAKLAVRAFPPDAVPAAPLLRLAETHRALAERLLSAADDDPDAPSRLAGLSPEDVEMARIHFTQAGHHFRRHASAAMVGEPELASGSLWAAADCYDRAGDQDEAIALFTDFVTNRRQDPRELEGRYRLARCFQARREYGTAIAIFEELLRKHAGTDESFRSFVPLAQCYLLRSAEGDGEKAERLLLEVLDGRTFMPTSAQFRRSLIELGQLYLRTARYPQAIARLTEAIERYPDAPESLRLHFDLADACRLSGAEISRLLTQAMPVSERNELERLRAERLAQGLELYDRVRSELDAMDPARLSEIQRILLRNSVLYRADCAFDLGDFESAIRYYDAAAQRFSSDPASLVPMVQIVNCYAALGRWPEARTAHQRARARLRELPDEAWQGAQIPMDRRHWERWLESSLRMSRLDTADAAGADPSAP